MTKKVITKAEVEAALVEDDAYVRKLEMSPEERHPSLSNFPGVEDFVNDITPAERAELRKLLTPAAWKD